MFCTLRLQNNQKDLSIYCLGERSELQLSYPANARCLKITEKSLIQFLKNWSLRSKSVPRHVNFNRKNWWKMLRFKNSNEIHIVDNFQPLCKVFKEKFWLENSKSMLISVNVVQMCWYTIVALLCLLYLRKCAWQKSGFNVWIWIALCQEMKRLKHDEWSYWKSIDTHRICERLERQKHDNMQLFPTKLWPSSVSHLSFKVEFTTAQTYTQKKTLRKS